jgi:decaprenyl-phosphate phosphoribosyltransferase
MLVLVRGIRPRQWSKNLLVLAAPVAAGIAVEPPAVLEMGVALLAFILA